MARRASIVVMPGNFRHVEGVAKLQRRFAALPAAIERPLSQAVERGVARLVATAKLAAPDNELTPAAVLRASIHAEPGATPIERRVIVDARDEKGQYIAKHVEFGHLAADGSHVAARPFFWPAYRVTRKYIRGVVQRGIRAGVKGAVGA